MITQDVRYAVMLVQEIKDGKQETVRHIADKYGLSVKFLEQVARKLRMAGLIAAKRGRTGGYHIVLNSLSLSQLFSALGHPLPSISCRLADECRGDAMCEERKTEAQITGAINDQMYQRYLI